MRPAKFLMTLTLISSLTPSAFAKLDVHEWGTMTSLVGSNGVTQTGMYHEDEQLPDFVHGFGEIAGLPPISPPTTTPTKPPSRPPRICRSKGCFEPDFLGDQSVTQKMETPVLYFYSDQAQDVAVNVKFPNGVVTETFPAPVATSPRKDTITDLKNGDTTFKVHVLPPNPASELFLLPYVDSANIYSHARKAASNMVKSGEEYEKFIFYRGIGQYQPTFSISSLGGNLAIAARFDTVPQAAYLIDVDQNGHARLIQVQRPEMLMMGGKYFAAKQIAKLRDHSISEDLNAGNVIAGERASVAIINGLVQAGLHLDEAAAMVATWEHGYLKVPGLRLLSILPRNEVDQILPLNITPKPDHVERVFVSRIEILLDIDEQKIVADVAKQGESFDISSLGRFAESKLRRARQVCFSTSTCQLFGNANVRVAFTHLIDRALNANEKPGRVSVQ